MKRILLHSKGRMCNQLGAWIKAMVKLSSHLHEVEFLLNYPPLEGIVELPKTKFCNIDDTKNWKPYCFGDEIRDECVWDEDDLWNQYVPHEDFCHELPLIKLNPSVTDEVDALMAGSSFIGCHVRYGDYIKVNWDAPPINLPAFPRIGNDYYLSNLQACQSIFPNHKVFLASDGTDEELSWFPENCVRNRKNANAALDLYALSRCEVIVGSLSTFSLFAAFYGRRPFVVPGRTIAEIQSQLKGST